MNVWRKPLPMVLREHVMDPIGASNTWRWHGYENSWVNIDGVRMQSVSGGGHWGGGINMVYVDQQHDLVIVGRWISNYEAMDGFVKRVIEAIDDK